jgi:hypothetical protein
MRKTFPAVCKTFSSELVFGYQSPYHWEMELKRLSIWRRVILSFKAQVTPQNDRQVPGCFVW